MFQYKRFLFYLFSIIFLTSVFSSQAKAESITDYSILATEKIHLKHRAKIKSGFVGVNDENLHESFELRLGRHVVTEPAVRLTAPRVILQKKAKVKGDVYYRDDLVLRHGAVILGQQVVRNGADDWPLFDIPVSPTCSPDGNNDVLVAKNQSDTLAAGVYGDITVKRRGTLVLSGGDYQMRTLHIGKNAKVIVSDDATLCVENHLMTRARAFLGADPDDSNVTAGDVKVYVNGEDQYHCPYDHSDDENDHHHNASAVKFGKRSVVFAQVKALNGTIKIRKAVQAHGAYIGKKVFVGKRSVITHEVNGNQPDVTAPQILGVNPVDGSTVGTADPIILAQFSDDDSGVDVGSVVILLDNVDVTTQANVTVSGFSFTASSLNNGAHSLSIQLSDLAGNATGSDTTFTVDVDVTPPEITQIIPVQGSVLNSATVSMSAMFSDLDSLIDVSSVVIRIDEFDITNDVILSETGFSITLDAPLADGTHSLFIHVEDTSGNATEVTTIFTVDTEAPLINVLIPTDGSLLANDLPQIQGNWSDVTSGVDSSTAQIILNGEDLTSSASITESGFDVTVTTPLSDGTHTLNISITDVAGNVGTGLITFTTDTSPPVFSNVVPVNGSTVTTNVPVISGDLSDNVSGIDTDSFQILIDGVDVTLADTATETNFSFTPSTPLSNGNHTVLLRVEDIAGNLTEITFSFNVLVDFVPPTISNIQPLNGSTLNTDTPTISATFSDDMSGINIANTQILLDNVDVTTQANATETGFSFVATSLSDGSHTLSISITDGNGNPAATNVTFSIDTTPPNQPPVLNVIGDQSVDLGTSLNFTVSGSDPNNDPLSFSVSPLPLPENSSFNSQTGFFNFVPQADQVGVISLTFKVSDGEFFDEEVVVITVEEPVVGAPTSISGRVLDTNSFVATGVEVPVVGAVVSLLNTGFSVVTDASGQFILSGVSAGHQILDINPSSANAAPDGSSYAGFREAINLMASVENIIERPLYLPRIATESLTPVDPNTTTIVTNPTLGISIEVPPNTAKNEDGSDFTGSLSISEVPEGLAPAAMPENLQPGLLITIQPVGVIFSTPVAITFPNIDNLPSGSRLDLWSLDPNGGVFVIVGTGEVSVDGSVIETTFGGIRRADWHSFLPPIVSLVGRVGNPTIQISSLCAKSCTGSETSLSSGSLSEKHSLASYRFFGQQQVLQFHYDSLRADPRPILKVNNRLGSIASPITISSQLKIAGIDQNIEIFTDVTALTLNDEIHQAIQFDGSSFNTGLYRYELISKNNYLFSSLSNSFTGRVVVNNQKDSPFGSGWTLGGLSHLKSTSGGHLLVDGDGSFFLFTKEVNLSAPMSNFAGGLPNTVAKGDFNEDGYLDLITVNQAADNISLLLGDGTGNFGFPSNFAVGITDPIQVTINDFNNDAHLDVALPGSPNNVISILFGDGTGGFAPLVQIPSPGGSGA
ncbi:T1SS secreted agglutinin RTX, partial [hydrothermal vent metagenome]